MTVDRTLASDIVGLSTAGRLTRRRFMTASAAVSAGYSLAAGPVRAQALKTDLSGLDAGDAAIRVPGGSMPVYYARPTGAKNPPVILLAMEIFGLHEYIKDVTRRLAKLGAFAIAPDYYFRLGNLALMPDTKQLMPLVNSKPDMELIADLDAAVEWAKAQGGDVTRLGITGFCRGGRTVWIYCAKSQAVKAGVAFYGSLVDPPGQKAIWPMSATELAAEMKAPVLGLYGGEDQGIPASQIDTMKAALAAAGKTAEFKIYQGAQHGFHADYRASFNKEAAEAAWQETQQWFKRWSVL